MRVVVTRPYPDGERTAAAVRARGHEVLLAPLMRIERVAADLSGDWGAVVITSANAPDAIPMSERAALVNLPIFAVGSRSARAALRVGFTDVISAGGKVSDLVRVIAGRHADKAPLLYLAGEDRAADLIGALTAHGIAAELRVIYRAVTVPFPEMLIAALKPNGVDAVLHFSKRSAENYIAGARVAGLTEAALAVRHLCLSSQIAVPLAGAGARRVAIAREPNEAALIELLDEPEG